MEIRSRLALAAVLVAATAGCARLTGLSDLTLDECVNGACDGAPSTPTTADGSGGTRPDGASAPGEDASRPPRDGGGPGVGDTGTESATDATADADATASGGDARPPEDAAADVGHDAPVVSCGGTAGPAMVNTGAFCIDSTEVTNKQYADFLAAKGSDLGALPPACSFKTSLAPSSSWPANPNKANDPVVYVDWCDAYAYCAYAGKRLCGAIAGGASSLASLADKNVDAWYAACSGSTGKVYPYGAAYVAGTCNDYEGKANGTRPVASYAGCVGGYSGIFDMSGNAYEWEDACAVSVGPSDSCIIRGGSWWFSGAKYGSCSGYFNDYTTKRSDAFNDTGFRCCSK